MRVSEFDNMDHIIEDMIANENLEGVSSQNLQDGSSQNPEGEDIEDEEGEGSENLDGESDDNIEGGVALAPHVGMEFSTEVEAYQYYNRYAKSTGFGVRKGRVDRNRKTKEIVRRELMCNKQGLKNMNDKRRSGKEVKRMADTRVNCTAKMVVSIDRRSNKWVVRTFDDIHQNHPLTSPNKVKKHRSHNQFHLTDECRELMDCLRNRGLRPALISRVMNAITGSEETITSQQCHDHLRVQRMSNIGHECMAIIHHFRQKKVVDKDFYFGVQLTNDYMVRSIFWADRRARENYRKFNDVLVFDVTYKTNNLQLPFAPFTGVNHHRQSTLFECALLADETEDTFVWLFNEWLMCMNGITPDAIITDQDKAICGAIKKVFPKAHHRYCEWHLAKHEAEHLQALRIHHETFFNEYNDWYWSNTIEDFEVRWSNLKRKYSLDDNSWLGKQYTNKIHWAPLFLKNIFFAGMKTTQRSESMNAYFDGYVNAQTSISDFVKQYDNALEDRRASELNEDFRTINSVPFMISRDPIKKQAAKIYTRKVFDIFDAELKDKRCRHRKVAKDKDLSITTYKVGSFDEEEQKWKTVIYNATNEEATCTCLKFESDGILCKHILNIMVNKRQLCAIPEFYIFKRWTIDARHRYFVRDDRVVDNDKGGDRVPIAKYLSLKAITNEALEKTRNSLMFHNKWKKIVLDFVKEVDDYEGTQQTQEIEMTSHSTPLAVQSQASSCMPNITFYDPSAPAKTKGRPKKANRVQSGLELSQEMASKKQRKCGNCNEFGHYRTSCTNPKVTNVKGESVDS